MNDASHWRQRVHERLAGLKLEPTREAEIVDEVAQHLADTYAEARATGASDVEALRLTLAELDEGALARELLRAVRPAAEPMPPPGAERRGNVMADFLQDVRFALRSFSKAPGFVVVAVLTLALGIGANATAFTWFNSVLLDPLPGVKDSGQLVRIYTGSKAQANTSMSYPDFEDLRSQATSFSGMTMAEETGVSLRVGEEAPQRVWGQLVSATFFDVLGVRPALGRTFLPEEDRSPGAHPVIVISHGLWQRRFAGRSDVVNQNVVLNNHAFTIVGVAPAGFQGSVTALTFDVWIPVMMVDVFAPGGERLQHRGNRWFVVTARRKPGVSLAQAAAELTTFAAGLQRQYPNSNEGIGLFVYQLWKTPQGAESVLGPMLLLLMGVVALVLLIACANVANLLLARATGRRKEIVVRLSLGASRWRLIRQLLTESALLALLAGALSIAVSFWTSGLLMALVPPTDFPVQMALVPGAPVLLFTMGIALVTGLIFGLAPAFHATRVDLSTALKDEAGSVAGGGRRKTGMRGALVVAQVALSLVLLVAAGLFLRSLYAAQTFALGFNPRNVLLAGIELGPNGYNAQTGKVFYEKLLQRLEAMPGVRAAALSGRVPLGFGGSSSTSIQVEGYEPSKEEQVWSYYYQVSPDYFRTMEIPLVSGREFSLQDRTGTPRVALVNEALAARYWPKGDALGKRLRLGDGEWITVVGIARDSKYRRLNEGPTPMFYLPLLQFYRSNLNIHLRTAGNPAGLAAVLQSEIGAIDPNLPVFNIRTLEGHIAAASFQQRAGSILLGVFGALALLLAAIGIYGVLAYMVSRRTHEIGIRVALGAQTRDVLWLVLRQGMRLTLLGLTIGIVAALGAMRFLGNLLFGVKPTDPLTFGGVALLLAGVAFLACYLPARRATRVDPLVALRYE